VPGSHTGRFWAWVARQESLSDLLGHKMAEKTRTTCAYCGARDPETKDHIPPKGMFPQPRPRNLITVPCCERCRAGSSEDDELFRTVVLSARETYDNKNAQMLHPKLVRALRRPNGAGFATLVRKSLTKVDIGTAGGIYLGSAPAMRIDVQRFGKVAQRIVTGLFFHEKNYRVPDGYEVANRVCQFGFDETVASLGSVPFVTERVIGDNMFRYTFATTSDDPNSTVWLSMFYQGLRFIGWTRRPETNPGKRLSRR